MKNLLVIGAMLFGASAMWATPVPACVSGATLAQYEALGSTGCQIGDKIFSNFTYSDSAQNALAILNSSVTVTTLGPTTGTDPAADFNANIGLLFNASWQATATGCPSACVGGFSDSLIGFQVTVVGGGMVITDTGLAQTSGVAGSGSSAGVDENACGPAPCTPGTTAVITFDNGTSTGTIRTADTTVGPYSSVQVSKDIQVTAAAVNGGQAGISAVSDTFSQSPTGVPEPGTMALAGLALCGIAMIRKRVKA